LLRVSSVIGALGLSAVLALGCAGPQKDRGTTTMKNDDGETMICHQEYPTGSHIGRTVCRTEEESTREREKARVLVTTPPPVPRTAPPPTGN
jgi:hypothetical protein